MFLCPNKFEVVCGFPAYTDGDWCSLEELGPLSQIKELGIEGLENVSTSLSVAKARIGAKTHLTKLVVTWGSRVGDDGLVKEVSEEEARRAEEVFHEICPLPCLEHIRIDGYFGRQLPGWMMSTATMPLVSLKVLGMHDLACCTELPDGLCHLPCLEFLKVTRAPAIKRVGSEFVVPHSQHRNCLSRATAAFPRLHVMDLEQLVKWEEWEWQEEAQAMPVLEQLTIASCKLGIFLLALRPMQGFEKIKHLERQVPPFSRELCFCS